MFNFKDLSREDILSPKDEILSDMCDFYKDHMVIDEDTGIKHTKDMRIRTYLYDMPDLFYTTCGVANDMYTWITKKFRFRKDVICRGKLIMEGDFEYWIFYVTPYIRIIISCNNYQMDNHIMNRSYPEVELRFLKHMLENKDNPTAVRFDQYFGEYYLPPEAPLTLHAGNKATTLEKLAPYVLKKFYHRLGEHINKDYIVNQRNLETYRSYPNTKPDEARWEIIRINNELDYMAGDWSEIIYRNKFNIPQHLFMVLAMAMGDILGEYATFDEVNTLICRTQGGGTFCRADELLSLLNTCNSRYNGIYGGAISYAKYFAGYYGREYDKIPDDLKRRCYARHSKYILEKHKKSNGKGGISC